MADGSLSENVYDALGRLTEARKFDILVPSGTAMTESALENVRGARHVGDGITRGVASTYDADGEVATIKDAAGNVQTYTYDARGNMRTWTDARGALWTYSYDRL
jgi:YD repeat-containing protein